MFFTPEFNLRHWRTFAQVIPLHARGMNQQATSGSTELLPSLPTTTLLGKGEEEKNAGVRQSVIFSGDTGGNVVRCLQERDFHRQHEKLAQYLDIVEVHLAEQVSKKSAVFFEAICCHDIVREQLKEAILQIKVVRGKLACIDASITSAIMQVHHLVRRRQTHQAILAKLRIIASLQAAQPTIQVLLRQNDFCAALDLVASTRDLLTSPQLAPTISTSTTKLLDGGEETGTSDRHMEQQQLTCLRHLNAQMEEISRFVRHMIVAEFEMVLRRFIETRSSTDTLSVNLPSHQLAAAVPDLVPCLLGLIHIQRHDFVSAFKAIMLSQIKACISLLPTVLKERAQQDTKQSIKEALRNLTNDDWIQVVNEKCILLDGLLRRAEEAVDVFTVTILRCANKHQPPADMETGHDIFSPRSISLPGSTVAQLMDQMILTLSNVATAAQQHIFLLVSPRLQQTTVNTLPGSADESLSTSGVTKVRSDLESTPPYASSTTSGINSDDATRLTVHQLIRLINILQNFLDGTYRTMHHEPATLPPKQQPQPKSTGLDTDNDPVPDGPVGGATPPASKLANLVALTTRGLIYRFHSERCQKMKLMLHQERWQPVNVPKQLQTMVSQTFERELLHQDKKVVSATDKTKYLPSDKVLWSFQRPTSNMEDISLLLKDPDRAVTDRTMEGVTCALVLREEPFVVVGTVLLLLPMLVEYAELAFRLPLQPWSVEELSDRAAVFLSLFNSGTCQLVLGAGAIKSTVLPKITVRNLALASRSLQLVAKCVPLLNAYFQRLINRTTITTTRSNGVETASQIGHIKKQDQHDTSVTPGRHHLINYLRVHHVRRQQNIALEHVDGLFSEHVSGINNKLVQILSDRISLQLSNWQVRPPTPSTDMRIICGFICRVAQMIGDILPVDLLTPLLLRAHSEFKVKLRQRLNELMVKADGGPQQSLVDSELTFYMQKLRPLSSRLTEFNDDFGDIWPAS